MGLFVRRFLLVTLLALGAVPLARAQNAPKPAGLRLGDAVKPLAYDAELSVVPTLDKFTGKITIDVDISAPTRLIWLNAEHLDLHKVTLTSGGHPFVGRAQSTAKDFASLRFAQTIPAGRASITIEYEGTIDRLENDGVFKLQDGAEWYVYTQFEDSSARRAFPCFDEPQWKTPWKIALDVRASDVAVANTAQTSEELIGNGLKRVHFGATAPLPSYLIAFGVGPFDVVDGGRAGRKNTPVRYIVPKGRAAETHFALQATPRILEILEDYFGQPYPFEKLDAMAVPIPFGAMENAGLITYQGDLMLARSDQESEKFRQDYVGTAAHEMAHQWFGDLVTPLWWDDIWLNEGFATWMGEKVTERFNPEWQLRFTHDEGRERAIAVDRLTSTRQVRQSVNNADDLQNAFDEISYRKGAAVLGMVEHWMGEERFRAGIRRYITEHAFGSARTEDLIAALSAEGGPDYASVGPMLRSAVEQPGVARVDVALECGADRKSPPRLDLTQTRFLPTLRSPEQRERFAGQKWVLPICFQFGTGADYGDFCTVLRDAHAVVPLPEGERCPAWVVANTAGLSYLLPSLKAELPQTLYQAPLLPEEAVPVLHDVAALESVGEFPVDTALAMAARFGNNRQPLVVNEAIPVVTTVVPDWYSGPTDHVAMARYIRHSFGARAAQLGWVPKPGERDVDAVLRTTLLPFVADQGEDDALRREADRLAHEWLAGRANLGGMLRPVLATAALSGGHDLLDAYIAALDKTTARADRVALFRAIGHFRDSKVTDDALAVALNDHFDARDALAVLDAAAASPATVGETVEFMHSHYDAILHRLPQDYGAHFARYGKAICDAGLRREFDYYFGDRLSKSVGGPRALSQALETIDICIAARDIQAPRLKAFLAAVPE